MINRLIEPSSGTIELDGVDTQSLDRVALRRRIGYVIQNAGLFPHRTVVDNVAALPRLLGGGKKETRSAAMELLERVGLDAKFAKRYPWQLSGGQQQRVGVARALATDPPFLLMDEPFSAVDPIVRSQLQDEFLRLQADISKTIVMVTHDIDEALKLGDQVVVLREGGTLAQAPPPPNCWPRPRMRSSPTSSGPRAATVRSGSTRRMTSSSSTDEPTITVGQPISTHSGVYRVDGSWRSTPTTHRSAGSTPRACAATASRTVTSTSAPRRRAGAIRCETCSTRRCRVRAGAVWSPTSRARCSAPPPTTTSSMRSGGPRTARGRGSRRHELDLVQPRSHPRRSPSAMSGSRWYRPSSVSCLRCRSAGGPIDRGAGTRPSSEPRACSTPFRRWPCSSSCR